MGRRDTKSPTSKPAKEKPALRAEATSAPIPSSPQPLLAPQESARAPRTTTDNPWRDLHPTRVWPD